MKHIFLLLTAFFLAGCTSKYVPKDNSHVLTSVNIVDREGLSETISNRDRLDKFLNVDFLQPQPYQKVLRVYGRDIQGNIPSHMTSYYPNGQAKQYLQVINNRANGEYKEWYSDGTLKLETHVIGGTADLNTAAEKSWLFDGTSQVWDPNGHLLACIQYNKGELEGYSTYFHSNGRVWKRTPFTKNEIQGLYEVFLDDGNLLQTIEYDKNLKNGPALRYWDGSKISSEETYDKGMLITGNYYDPSGKLITKIINGNGKRALFGKDYLTELQDYLEGYQQGLVTIFDKQGRTLKTYHTQKGQKHGEEIEYQSESGSSSKMIPWISINWYEGKIQGHTKTWYKNGTMESQKEMSNNYKNGLSTAWYKDGSLMMIEEYDRDALVKGEYFKKGEKKPVSIVLQGEGSVTLHDSDGGFLRKIPYHLGKPQE